MIKITDETVALAANSFGDPAVKPAMRKALEAVAGIIASEYKNALQDIAEYSFDPNAVDNAEWALSGGYIAEIYREES